MRNIILSLFLFSSLLADDHTIAVLDFSGENIHKDELKNLSAVFRTELLQMDTLRVLNYDDMSDVLIDYGNTTSCSSLECAVIASMLLDQEWLVSAHVSKIGDVFLIEARLIESSTGRVINAVSYDYDLSIEGLYTRGMHNLSDLVMSKRIPLEIHKRQNLVYFKTNPTGAMVRVGNDTLNGTTPLAVDRVVVESRPIVVFKEDYKPFRVERLQDDDSDIIFIQLKLKVPKIGNVVFKEPVPDDISINSSIDNSVLLIDEGNDRIDNLPAGNYRLVSDTYVIKNNYFTIKHRRTTKSSPVYYPIKEIVDKKSFYLKRRNIYLQILGGGLTYRSFITIRSSYLYNQYTANSDNADKRHRTIDNLDNQKPVLDVFSSLTIFPIVYYHAKFLEMERWLKN
ncbi:MAG: hypothetical protein ACJZ15_03420 [Candidatus Neomarinimicrobiota bacterium]|nr:MAG: hypothetical protein DBW60_04095 [bacterium]|tara:strand:- start:588 stop:1778 length:1191 start_codon:yes stop_codon:yes gene_type:complete